MQLRADSDLPKRKELLFKIRSVLLTAATLICYFFNQQIIVIMFWLSSIWRLESQNMVSSQQWGGRPCDQLAVQVPPSSSSSSTPLLSSLSRLLSSEGWRSRGRTSSNREKQQHWSDITIRQKQHYHSPAGDPFIIFMTSSFLSICVAWVSA